MNGGNSNIPVNIKQEILGPLLPPPPPTHHAAAAVEQHHQHQIHQLKHGAPLSRPLCNDPEIEETIRRLTQNLKTASERLTKEDIKPILENGQKGAATSNSTGIPMHEAFVLSIEELDNNSVNELMFSGKKLKPKQRHIYESPEARARRLARNAERMRERRSNESEDEYRARLFKMAEASRLRRRNENEIERAMRLVRDAARQRLRRALESPDQRSDRLAKLAQRAREVRLNESPDQRSERLRKLAEHHRNKYARQRQAKKMETIKPEQPSSNPSTTSTYPSGTTLLQNVPTNLSFSQTASIRTNDFVQSPSSSSSGSSEVTSAYQQHINSQYHLFRSNHFPDLPAHLAPNRTPTELIPPQWIPNQFPELSQNFPHTSLDAKYYQKIQQALSPTSSIPPPVAAVAAAAVSASVLSAMPPVTSSSASVILTPPTTPQFYRPQTQYQTLWPPVQSPPTVETSFVRGRPIKILPSNDYRSINPEMRDEAERQQRMNDMLEAQINQMLTSPRGARGRPNKGKESDPERLERLRKMAETRRLQRQRETPDERAARLKDLADRARRRRESILATESEDERKIRLQRQAEYARQRRLKSQTPEALKLAEQRARNLYTTLHGGKQQPQSLHQQHQPQQQKQNGKF